MEGCDVTGRRKRKRYKTKERIMEEDEMERGYVNHRMAQKQRNQERELVRP